MSNEPTRVVILGAAGRDFHDFNTFFRGNRDNRVVAFTATQIPNIEGRVYPAEIAGPDYPEGIPIVPEEELEEIVERERVDLCVFSYSDISHAYVMHMASRVLAAGAAFQLLGPRQIMLESERPVIAVCAVRTGAGKSQTTRYVVERLREFGHRPVVVRHPMPYGDLVAQRVQRFESYDDLDRYDVTIEEREEYEPHIARGSVVYAGVDYEAILRQAEKEADVVLWDGGNNDLPFYRPNLHIVVADPHRPGHEIGYHPGEANLRVADAIIINKIGTAKPEDIDIVRRNIAEANPGAVVFDGESPLTVDDPAALKGKRVLAVEDGPSLTHGELSLGAASLAAKQSGAAELVDPRPFAVGSIVETFARYTTTGPVLPAMGYGEEQIRELSETIRRSDADVVAVGTPIDLGRLIDIDKPIVRVKYDLAVDRAEEFDRLIKETVG
ncbi:MAG: GTPase [Gemmatimonadetes bacterium]|uniref:GTPase n=1 Tax=Candidatus Kutchimonas denitrificans TaxID=3056748 RepID=A0AAE4Z666_9BACT|nr:GTPase [Gemmatimonadota bacterium]NIR74333.1 GTPase [Candidatus Kutchimonas denitrificans]NIS02584.1 GTPase [Gemmatimonadota bacterium]NIT68459.1 GTPase [Gemmatimonadota bacterium]NIU51936.1 GTPase [Gemmatimonadota bacterium]